MTRACAWLLAVGFAALLSGCPTAPEPVGLRTAERNVFSQTGEEAFQALSTAPQGRDGVPFEPGNDVLRWDEIVIPKRFRFDR